MTCSSKPNCRPTRHEVKLRLSHRRGGIRRQCARRASRRWARQKSAGLRPAQSRRWQRLRSSRCCRHPRAQIWTAHFPHELARNFRYLSRFTAWRKYEHRVLASVDGQLLPIPINLDTINRLYGLSLNENEVEGFPRAARGKDRKTRAHRKRWCSAGSGAIFTRNFSATTRANNGAIDPSQLDAQVTARIPVRTNHDDRYFTDQFPIDAEARLHPHVRKYARPRQHRPRVRADYRELRDEVDFGEVIYSGPIDEFFDYRFGKLPYRSLHFEHQTFDQEWLQPVAVVNYPNEHDYTRITEFKHLTGQQHAGPASFTSIRGRREIPTIPSRGRRTRPFT